MTALQLPDMSSDAGIRLERLKSLFARPIELREKTGRSASFCSDLLNGRKSFGEKLARDLEEQLSLPRGWFDSPVADAEKSSGSDEAALLAAFRALSGDAVATARALAYVEGLAAAAADSLGGASHPGGSQNQTQKQAA